MKNVFNVIAILMAGALIFALTGIIISLYVNKTFGLVLYILGGVCLIIMLVVIIVNYILLRKNNKN